MNPIVHFNLITMKKISSIALQKINPEVVLTIAFLLMILIFIKSP